MLEEIKTLLGEAATNYSDAQILLCYDIACAEIEDYCNTEMDATLEFIAASIAVIKLNMLGSEGSTSESFSGVTQSYINDYPENIKSVLNRKRMIICY